MRGLLLHLIWGMKGMKRIKAIDLFSGCGGVSCGLTKSGFVVKAAVEVDEDAANIYSGYHALSNVLVLKKDICTVTGKELLSAAGIKPGEMYLMAGCPPCQKFSIKNPKNKEKSMALRKKLFFQFLRIIKETYPPFILMENVPGIANKTNEKILMQFLRELENKKDKKSRQYIIKKGILNAADYGVPQIRMRFVLHGIRADIYDRLKELNTGFELPTATHSRDGKNNLKKWVTAKEAIGDLPRIQAGSSYKGRKQIYNHKCAGLSGQNMERMKYIRKHGGSRTCLPPKMA
ncbi:MAG: DNA cytosine methyltransferase, partial [Bacteroidaceae bacterium]|nr:DNA cytosine methyltransferase [Bacteroidaceae bacterium]